MTKYEACHRLAEINEAIYDIQNLISDIESRMHWDNSSKIDWCEERLKELKDMLSKLEREHDDFLREFGYIIYS